MKYLPLIFIGMVFLLQNQEAEADLPQKDAVGMALTTTAPQIAKTFGVLITSSDSLSLLKRPADGTAPRGMSVDQIVPSASDANTFLVLDLDKNLLATMTVILNKTADGNAVLGWVKNQPASSNPSLTYTTPRGTKIVLSGAATTLIKVARASTGIAFQSVNNGQPQIIFQNAGKTVGAFPVTISTQL